jgi:tRNA pseudouridine13 synthase
MKLKQLLDDFHVEELTDCRPGNAGSFAFYSLRKRGWTTPDALHLVRRRWRLDLNRLSFGGLKDRHASTVQYFTILKGPRRRLNHHEVHVEYIGQLEQPFSSHNIRANRFRLAIRDLTSVQVEAASQNIKRLEHEGVPNYFDDQRFGSVGKDGVFVARLMVQGRFEEALRLALSGPYTHDRSAQKKEKAFLAAHWGSWQTCKDRLRPGNTRSIAGYLSAHPGDFRGALERLRPELHSLYLSAFQSHLWNRMLANWLLENLPDQQRFEIALKTARVPFHRNLSSDQVAKLRALELPFPTARYRPGPNDPNMALMTRTLAAEGLELAQLKLTGFRKLFFSRGFRPALCMPDGLCHDVCKDELNANRQRLEMTFELPPGSYATLLVKAALAPNSSSVAVDPSASDEQEEGCPP